MHIVSFFNRFIGRICQITIFIEFMLELLLRSIEDIISAESRVNVKVNVKVSVNQQKIIDEIKKNPYVTIDELAGIVGIAKKNIFNNMKKMQGSGLIRRIGADKNGHWEIIKIWTLQ